MKQLLIEVYYALYMTYGIEKADRLLDELFEVIFKLS